LQQFPQLISVVSYSALLLTVCCVVYVTDEIRVWNSDVHRHSGTFCIHYCEYKVLRWICQQQ